jgi:hypothetical protein
MTLSATRSVLGQVLLGETNNGPDRGQFPVAAARHAPDRAHDAIVSVLSDTETPRLLLTLNKLLQEQSNPPD